MMLYAFELDHVTYKYNGIPALDDATFQLPEKEFLAIIGPNGGGKTTLVKLLLGLLKPTSGEVRVFGKHPAASKFQIGYVSQNTDINKDFPISVYDAVMMGRIAEKRRFWGGSAKDQAVVNEKLEILGLWDYRNYRIGELSGGQRQRALIARALVVNPKILLLDEPTSGVDSPHQIKLFDILKELNQSMTVAVVTHDYSVISKNVTSIACVNRKVYLHGSAELTSEMLEMAYGTGLDGQCPVELIAHGIPHRVLPKHKNNKGT